ADDGLFVPGVVVKDAVTRPHLPQVAQGQVVVHAVSERGAVALQLTEVIVVRLLLEQPQGHRSCLLRSAKQPCGSPHEGTARLLGLRVRHWISNTRTW